MYPASKFSILSLAFIFIIVTTAMSCKSDSQQVKNESAEEKGVAIVSVIDSSMIDNTMMQDFHFVSIPQLTSWNKIGKSLIKLDNYPSGYTVTDTISWLYPSGRSFMSMTHATTSGENDVDFKMYYEKIKSMYPYNEYSYTKYNAGPSSLYEVKLVNDSINTYKLIIPKGNELIQLNVLSHARDYNEEIAKTLEQLPGLISIK